MNALISEFTVHCCKHIHVSVQKRYFIFMLYWLWLGLWCFAPLLTIFQVYRYTAVIGYVMNKDKKVKSGTIYLVKSLNNMSL